MRVAFVYLLRCADDTLYCGWTTDVGRRLAAHRAGTASRYTRSRRPVVLAAVISVPDRSAALREEARIKRLPRAAKLQVVARIRRQPPSGEGGIRVSPRTSGINMPTSSMKQ
jgi:putative endonuclease